MATLVSAAGLATDEAETMKRDKVEDWDAKVGECWKCSGTGQYSWQKRAAGGKAVVVTGMCFQCRGKGWMSHRDEMRTGSYWCHRGLEG